jgi:two-component system, OmpR family, osmolarity sensor histidine kinase EnvZ
MTRFADSMFARTALLAAASGLVFAILFLAVGRSLAGLPAIRASAAMLAEVLALDPQAVGQSNEEPPLPRLRDEVLARTLIWRTFAGVLEEKLGPGAKLAIRADEAGAVVWAFMPAAGRWARWHTELPSEGLRAGVLAMLIGIAAAVLVGGMLLARQITGPLRELARIADRLAAGELLQPTPPESSRKDLPRNQPGRRARLRGPREVRRVHEAFQRLCGSLRLAEQDREAILAGVSHDLRTPISRLRFVLELYGEGAAPRLLDEVERELQDLEQAATRFIAYARSNYEEPFDLMALDALVTSAIGSHRFAGNVAFEPGAPAPALLQPGNVYALVENLLENARKHGAAPIHVHTRQSADEVQVIVRDGGTGIAATDQRTALQPFVRLTEQDAPGSGLGLAIVARVAKRHNGRVEMRNRADGFEIRVTLRPPPQTQKQVEL